METSGMVRFGGRLKTDERRGLPAADRSGDTHEILAGVGPAKSQEARQILSILVPPGTPIASPQVIA
jgi:hypothetical protein